MKTVKVVIITLIMIIQIAMIFFGAYLVLNSYFLFGIIFITPNAACLYMNIDNLKKTIRQ